MILVLLLPREGNLAVLPQLGMHAIQLAAIGGSVSLSAYSLSSLWASELHHWLSHLKASGVERSKDWETQGQALALTYCVTVGKSAHLFELQFVHFQSEEGQI